MGYSLCLNDVGLVLVTVTANEINQEARCSFSTDWLISVHIRRMNGSVWISSQTKCVHQDL